MKDSYPLFEKIGIYGYEEVEPYLLYALITGMPVLLMGMPGSGKTLIVERIAALTGLKFHPYDASKALFEDIVGFPDPEKLKGGKIDYIRGELTLWDKEIILIDEINRAQPTMQNKWLEVIRSRRLMGLPLSELKYIFAAMNPPEYRGTLPLEEALADRFSFFIILNPPDEEYFDSIVLSETKEDMPLLEKDFSLEPDKELMEYIRRKQDEINRLVNGNCMILKLLEKFHFLWNRELSQFPISYRRWKMIFHNLIGIKVITGRLDMESFKDAIIRSLPFKAMDEEFSEKEYQKVDEIVYTIFTDPDYDPVASKVVVHTGYKNPFRIAGNEGVRALIDFIIALHRDWSSSRNSTWLVLWLLKLTIDSIAKNDNGEIIKEAIDMLEDFPPFFLAEVRLIHSILLSNRIERDFDEIATMIINRVKGEEYAVKDL